MRETGDVKAQPPAVTSLGLRPGVGGGPPIWSLRVMRGLSLSSVSAPRGGAAEAHTVQAAVVPIIGHWVWSPALIAREGQCFSPVGWAPPWAWGSEIPVLRICVL